MSGAAVCLSAYLQSAVSVILSAGVPAIASGLEERIGTVWEREQCTPGAT